MAWVSITLRVNGSRKMKAAGKKVAAELSFLDLAHQLTNNEFVGDETVKVTASIT